MSSTAGQAPGRLYFAYGSNLWLEQMAARCPASYFIGRGVLPDHRWQTNQRGVINITPCSGNLVHGLVYELGADDERRLDRSEGVHTGAYSKVRLCVILHPTNPALEVRTQTLVKMGGAEPTMAARSLGHGIPRLREQPARLEPDVLVYLSEVFARPGDPRDEYIDRMNYAISDAIELGIPADLFKNAVRRYIPERPPPRRRTRHERNRSTHRSRAPSRPARREPASSETAGPKDSGGRGGQSYGRRPRNPSPVQYRQYYAGDPRAPRFADDHESWNSVDWFPLHVKSSRWGSDF